MSGITLNPMTERRIGMWTQNYELSLSSISPGTTLPSASDNQ